MIKNTPRKIYLNIGTDEPIDDFSELEEITWAADKIFEQDIEYRLVESNSGSVSEAAKEVATKIFYSPATNGKSEQSIEDGTKAILDLIAGSNYSQSNESVWNEACKATLESISKMFLNPVNLSKVEYERDAHVFTVIGETIKSFPHPEYQPNAYKVEEDQEGLFRMVKDRILSDQILEKSGVETNTIKELQSQFTIKRK